MIRAWPSCRIGRVTARHVHSVVREYREGYPLTYAFVCPGYIVWGTIEHSTAPAERPVRKTPVACSIGYRGAKSFLRTWQSLNWSRYFLPLFTPEFHCHVHNGQSLVHILIQFNSAYNLGPVSYFLSIHFNIIIPCTTRYVKCSFSLTQN